MMMMAMASLSPIHHENMSIAVIDLTAPRPDTDLAQDLVNAATTHGFIFIRNQDEAIPHAGLEDMFALVSLVVDMRRL